MVFGISGDSPAANGAFAKQLDVHFPLLSDPGLKVLKQYGVPMRVKQVGTTSYDLAQRATFVIDKQGKIVYAEQTPTPKDLPNFDAVKAALAKL